MTFSKAKCSGEPQILTMDKEFSYSISSLIVNFFKKQQQQKKTLVFLYSKTFNNKCNLTESHIQARFILSLTENW